MATALRCPSGPLMSGVHGLARCGFPHSRLVFDRPCRGKGFNRIQIVAAREAATFDHYGRVTPPERSAPGWRRRLRALLSR